MYIDVVCKGIDDIPTVDEKTRATMKRRLEKEGLEALVEELKEALLGREIEEFCIGECGSEFTAYVGDDLVTADSQEDFIEKCK